MFGNVWESFYNWTKKHFFYFFFKNQFIFLNKYMSSLLRRYPFLISLVDEFPSLSLLQRYPFFIALVMISLLFHSCDNIPSLLLARRQLLVIFIGMTNVAHLTCNNFLESLLLQCFLRFITLSMKCEAPLGRPNIHRNIHDITLQEHRKIHCKMNQIY